MPSAATPIHDLTPIQHPCSASGAWAVDLPAAGGTSPAAYALFVATNFVLFLRPAELSALTRGIQFYEPLILLSLLTAGPRVLALLKFPSLLRNPVTACVVLLLPLTVLSPLSQGDLYHARADMTGFLKLVLYYLLVVANLHSPQRIRSYIVWLGAFSVMMSALALLSYHHIVEIPAFSPMLETQEGILDPSTGKNIVLARLSGVGIFDNPNDIARLITTGMTIAICWIISSPSFLARLLWVGPLSLLGYALYLTSSRGAFVGLLGALLPALFARFGKKKAIALTLLVLPLTFVLFSSRITNISASEGTGQSRIQLWAEGIAMMRSSPLFGIGMYEYGERMHLAMHNSFLEYYVELGFIGGTLFVGAYALLLRELSRMGPTMDRTADERMRRLRPAVVALLAGYGLGLLTCNRAFQEPSFGLMGVGAAYLSLVDRTGLWPARVIDRRLITWLLGTSVSVFVVLALCVKMSVHWSG